MIQVKTTAILLFSCLMATNVSAAIEQKISFSYDPDLNIPFNSIQDSDNISGATPADINRALLAGISGNGFNALGSVGEFGSYGLSGQLFGSGELSAQVYIRADVDAPAFGIPRTTDANFIIDGGSFQLLADPNSSIRFVLTLLADNRSIFQSGFDITGDSTFVNPSVNFFGTDIGAVQDPLNPWKIDVPFSFQSASLGVINPGQSVEFVYQLDIIATAVGNEGISFKFEDPLSITPPLDDLNGLRPTISSVPLPASVWLFGSSLISLLMSRVRRKN